MSAVISPVSVRTERVSYSDGLCSKPRFPCGKLRFEIRLVFSACFLLFRPSFQIFSFPRRARKYNRHLGFSQEEKKITFVSHNICCFSTPFSSLLYRPAHHFPTVRYPDRIFPYFPYFYHPNIIQYIRTRFPPTAIRRPFDRMARPFLREGLNLYFWPRKYLRSRGKKHDLTKRRIRIQSSMFM